MRLNKKHYGNIPPIAFVVILVAIIAFFFFTSPSRFTLVNLTNEPVSVTAYWGNESLEIGELEADVTYKFSVDAKATMKFVVRYPSGATIESQPIYFSAGVDVVTTISEKEVSSKHVFET